MEAIPQFELATADVVITVAYFVGVVAHGLWHGRHQETADDYFLAGRALPWYLVGFSLFASNMSGASFVGLIGAAYDHGLAVFNYEWTATVVLVFFALFMLPCFLHSGLYTIPEYLETRYDRRARVAFSAFTVLAILFVDTAGALYAGGVVLTTVFEFTLWQAVAGLAVLAGVYTILGGLKAVVVTDTAQAVLLMFGAAAICFFGLRAVGGWDAMAAALEGVPGRRMSLGHPVGHDFLPWPGIFGVILLGFYYWTLNQFVVQRTLGSRDLDQGRKGALFAGLLKIPNLFLMIVPGMFAVLLYPNIANPDVVFPTLAFDLLPVGFRGLVVTGLIAAIMSSLDSALNAGSTLVTMDFVRPLRPGTSPEALMRIGRLVTAGMMAFAAFYAPMIRGFENLFDYFQSVLAYVTPPVVAVYVLGIFWRRLNAAGAFWTILLGLAAGVPLFVLKEVTGVWAELGLPALHYTYMAGIMFLLGCVLVAGISWLTGPPEPAEMEDVTFTRENFRRDLTALDRPWYGDFRWQAAGLLLLVAGTVGWFW